MTPTLLLGVIQAVANPPFLVDRLAELTGLVENAQKFILAMGGFLTVGVTGLIVAWSKIRQQLRAVEKEVSPTKAAAEITLLPDDTLRMKVESLAHTYDSDKAMRDEQHESNTSKLDMLQRDVATMRNEVSEIRSLVQRVLARMAGLV